MLPLPRSLGNLWARLMRPSGNGGLMAAWWAVMGWRGGRLRRCSSRGGSLKTNNTKQKGKYMIIPYSRLALVALFALGWASGYTRRDLSAKAQIAQIQREAAEQERETLAGSLKRYEAWAAKADAINQTQTATAQQIRAAAEDLKKAIPDVIQQDKTAGSDCAGLGAYSLQHYQKSLGY